MPVRSEADLALADDPTHRAIREGQRSAEPEPPQDGHVTVPVVRDQTVPFPPHRGQV